MRFSQCNRFKFTRRNIVDEAFYGDADISFIKEKLYEYNKNNVAVYDYTVIKGQSYPSVSVLFRIIKPRYQIAYKGKGGKVYYSETAYRMVDYANEACDLLNKNESDTREYYVETISYLDEKI